MPIRLHQQGFTLLEMIVSLIVLCSLLGLGAIYLKDSADRSEYQAMAANLREVTEAAKHYVKDHYATIQDEVVGSGLTKTIELNNSNSPLIKDNYLSKHFPIVNSYGQNYLIKISKENDDLMQVAVITVAGQPLTEASMLKITAMAGGDTGYISLLNSNTITGSQKAWTIPTFDNATAGHLASINYINAKDIVNANDFLRRNNNGGDRWNTMETALIMNDNKIRFTSGAIEFDNKKQKASFTSNKIILKEKNDSSTITPSKIEVKGESQIANSSLNHTQLSSHTVKPGVILIDRPTPSNNKRLVMAKNGRDVIQEKNKELATKKLYQTADNICIDDKGDNIGKLFMVGFTDSNQRTLFMCGKNNESSTGRAYVVGSSGEKIEVTPYCDGRYNYWVRDPNRPAKDRAPNNPHLGCIVSYDGRTIEYYYLEFKRQREMHVFYTRKGDGTLKCKHNSSRTQKTNICYPKKVTRILEPIEKLTFPLEFEIYNHQQCNDSTMDLDVHNVYLAKDIHENLSDDRPTICGNNNSTATRVKSHR